MDIKVKHGVIGLLKHLAQSSTNSPTNRAALSESGVVHRLVSSGIWDEKGDAMAEVVQMGAIGVVKHLCNGSSEHFHILISVNLMQTDGEKLNSRKLMRSCAATESLFGRPFADCSIGSTLRHSCNKKRRHPGSRKCHQIALVNQRCIFRACEAEDATKCGSSCARSCFR